MASGIRLLPKQVFLHLSALYMHPEDSKARWWLSGWVILRLQCMQWPYCLGFRSEETHFFGCHVGKADSLWWLLFCVSEVFETLRNFKCLVIDYNRTLSWGGDQLLFPFFCWHWDVDGYPPTTGWTGILEQSCYMWGTISCRATSPRLSKITIVIDNYIKQ